MKKYKVLNFLKGIKKKDTIKLFSKNSLINRENKEKLASKIVKLSLQKIKDTPLHKMDFLIKSWERDLLQIRSYISRNLLIVLRNGNDIDLKKRSTKRRLIVI